MKTNKKIERNKNKLIYLNLIRYLNKNEKKTILKKNLINYNYQFKKALYIIVRYQAANKKILFIGFPDSFVNKVKYLYNMKNNTFIYESTWINGILLNQLSIMKHLINNVVKFNRKHSSKSLFDLRIHYDLVVILNKELFKSTLIEIYERRIPVILLNSSSDLFCDKLTYKVEKNNLKLPLFLFMLYSVFKRVKTFNLSSIKYRYDQSSQK